MAVWASFPFDNRVISDDGTTATWEWAMSQWDRVAQAGHTVRLVVVDQALSGLPASTSEGQRRIGDLKAKLEACRAAGQLLFGRVYGAGGKLPLGQPGDMFDDPLKPDRQVAGFVGQTETWHALLGDQLDGIFIDEGPRDCTDPAVAGSNRNIPGAYARYVSAIRERGYRVFIQALQHPDADSNQRWLRNLEAEFIQLWQRGVTLYRTGYHALDPCHPGAPDTLPDWWDAGESGRWSRVHLINDCGDAATMQSIARLAIDKRAAGTIWITRPRLDPSLGPVYDTLPPYFDDEVAFFRPIVDQEEHQAKDVKDQKDGKDDKDSKEEKEAKEAKDSKDGKDEKESKEEKDSKDSKDEKESKEEKDGKDNKDDKDNSKEDPKEKNEDKEQKEDKDAKDIKDEKDEKEDPPEFLKDSETAFKTIEVGRPAVVPVLPGGEAGMHPDGEAAAPPRGRTFIRGYERPLVGERIVADPAQPDPAR